MMGVENDVSLYTSARFIAWVSSMSFPSMSITYALHAATIFSSRITLTSKSRGNPVTSS